jgi:hypothetical protein
MVFPTLPADALKNGDYDLGRLLLAYFLKAQAYHAGLPVNPIPYEFAKRVTRLTRKVESSTAMNAAVALALHKAARGDFESAGRLLREHLDRESKALRFIPIGINRALQAAKFGTKGAKANKAVGAENRQAVLVAATDILAAWITGPEPSERRLAELVAQRVGLSMSACRTHLKKLREEKRLV